MKTLKITWLSCDKCDAGDQQNSFVSVKTEKGCGFSLYVGDKAECPSCGAKGVIDADGESTWVVWDEDGKGSKKTTLDDLQKKAECVIYFTVGDS